ncbi:MAG: lipopolysaccharide heptosyltransferase II [Nitrospirae bacterium]|nr:lipopolysaccharide heptosyltransferase II [Nitrospirota bacterium]
MQKIDLKNILIIKPSSIGDIIHALPFLKAIKTKYPKAAISWLINRGLNDLIADNLYLNEVILFERKRWGGFNNIASKYREFTKFIKNIRSRRFDAVIDLQGLFRSGIITYFSGADYRIGFANARELSPIFYNHKVFPPNKEMHAVDRYLLIAKELDADISKKEFMINIPKKEDVYVSGLVKRNGRRPLIAINPSARWQTKMWPLKRYAELIDTIAAKLRAQPVLIGGKEDEVRINGLLSMTKSKPLDLSGKTTLLQLAALLKRVELLITNDSGPMHIAAAVGTPVVALFGPTKPKRTGPYGNGHVVIQKDISCIGCLKKSCDDLKCMDAISVDEVFNSVRGLIKNKSGI